ncbi:Nucleoside-diphosphate-sugar epimerase [Paenibacillus sp. UNCCL117]|uniref:NAD-dependent epimerase/dehydratase family protein n=1 Tax=unclassified Paenibacillus TaxID=185978 RepID=UPI0008828DBF|nr:MULTISPECIES: NAD-dependent epimerase/dehydratase family protein [unclassified Paenibacillus]SDD23253.1 Nucleoside-diphosphate-sugar epimerase [Paenibacillus sp. cl123]SFW41716.1 Nucleoside-diphosphate-sugar epimerase [Paenibacillus sp. UNCCL117]
MKALVTGGTGFLGGHLARRLCALGWEVTAAGRNEEQGRRLRAEGIRFASADLADGEKMQSLCAGQTAVFHCGAMSAAWGRYADFYASNVSGTAHVVEGCLKHEVRRLIHVSTPSIYFGAAHRLNVNERMQPAARQASSYSRTKWMAEQIVRQGLERGLQAVLIRPRAIFGPGDRTILPKLIRANAKSGVPMIDGGRGLVDLTYVDNAVEALILAYEAPDYALGQPYNITNGEPMKLADAASMLFAKLGQPLRTVKLPFAAAYGLGAILELAAALRPGAREPELTRASAGMLGRSQTLDISAARRDLGYVPAISVAEGLERFAGWWREREGAEA